MTPVDVVNLFSLNVSSGIPIYRQLMDQIKQAIRLSLLRRNELLPSVRNLATTLQINPMTISKAYAQLEKAEVLGENVVLIKVIKALLLKRDNRIEEAQD